MNKELIFYTNPMSRGQIVRWMLEEVGAQYRQELIAYGEQIKSSEYRAINPMGKIPAIKHGDKVITECAAICAYLADAFPESALVPSLDDRADYYRWLFFAAGPLESAITNKSLGIEPNDEQQRTAGYGNYELVIGVLDDFLGSREYVCGDQFTAADVYLGSQIDFGLQFNSIDATDNFTAYVERLKGRSAYNAAKKIDMDLMPKQ